MLCCVERVRNSQHRKVLATCSGLFRGGAPAGCGRLQGTLGECRMRKQFRLPADIVIEFERTQYPLIEGFNIHFAPITRGASQRLPRGVMYCRGCCSSLWRVQPYSAAGVGSVSLEPQEVGCSRFSGCAYLFAKVGSLGSTPFA